MNETIALAINYSPAAARLYREGAISVDRFKVPPWPELIREARRVAPVQVHLELALGDGSLAATDWAALARMLDETDTPYVNLHLGPKVSNGFRPGHDLNTTAGVQALLDHLAREIDGVCARFGAERVIVENVPDRVKSEVWARPIAMPDHITWLIERTGAGLLLDISHARLSARVLELDDRAYLSALPVHALRELHVTGLALHQVYLIDHMPMNEAFADWDVLDWALANVRDGAWARPWLLAFEYGGVAAPFEWRSDPAVIAAQVPALKRRVDALNAVAV